MKKGLVEEVVKWSWRTQAQAGLPGNGETQAAVLIYQMFLCERASRPLLERSQPSLVKPPVGVVCCFGLARRKAASSSCPVLSISPARAELQPSAHPAAFPKLGLDPEDSLWPLPCPRVPHSLLGNRMRLESRVARIQVLFCKAVASAEQSCII